MKAVALAVIMAQIGCFVPAESAVIHVFRSMHCHYAQRSSIALGASSFMADMRDVSSIVQQCTDRSLVIFDEIGTGTAPSCGVAIARAVLTKLVSETKAVVLCATHYLELCDLESFSTDKDSNHSEFINLHAESRESGLLPSFRIVQGRAMGSQGIELAEALNLPTEITSLARLLKRDFGDVGLNTSSA
jgi:DNA mismatch repair ATPase MutS